MVVCAKLFILLYVFKYILRFISTHRFEFNISIDVALSVLVRKLEADTCIIQQGRKQRHWATKLKRKLICGSEA
jgi:hypothetical protein